MFSSIYITVGSEAEGEKIVKHLLDQGLIACANMFPIKSYYYWEDKLQQDSEFAVIMKTRTELIDSVITKIKELHSYEIPCIVSWAIEKGNQEYLDWIKLETSK